MCVRKVLLSVVVGHLCTAVSAAPTRLKCEAKAPVERVEFDVDPEAKSVSFLAPAGWKLRQNTVVIEPSHMSWTATDAQGTWRYMRLDRKTLQIVEVDRPWACSRT